MSNHDKNNKTHHRFNPLEDVSLGEGVDLAIGLTATALTADQLIRLAHTKKHAVQHIIKGGLSAGLATAAFTMMAREHRENHEKKAEKERRRREHLNRHRLYPSDDNDDGYYSDDDRHGRTMALGPPRSTRRGSSTHSTYAQHFRDRSLDRSLSPPRRRAFSQTPTQDRTFSERHPNITNFMEQVRDNLRDDHR